MKNLIALTLLLGGSTLLCAQKPAKNTGNLQAGEK